MKWKWKCNICGAEGTKGQGYHKVCHYGRIHSKVQGHEGFDLTMIREDGVVRIDKNPVDKEAIILQR